MSFNEQLPQWDNTGTEPPVQKKTDGWQTSEKPPAGWLNWLFNKIYLAIKELQEKAVDKNTIPTNVASTDTEQTLSNKTLDKPKIPSGGYIADANGNEQIKFVTTAAAVNELTVTNAATGSSPKFTATGGDADIGIDFVAKGMGVIRYIISNSVAFLIEVSANAVNYLKIKANSAGTGPNIEAMGTDASIDINLVPKGTGVVKANGKQVSLKEDLDAHTAETTTGITQPHGLPKCKYNATTAPTANDDSGDGYSVGSVWIDTTNDKQYVCLDATLNVAIWQENGVNAESVNRTITVGVGKDFATIQAAINSIKKRVDATITINIDAGTYAEDVLIKGFGGTGSIIVNGGTDLTTAVNYIVNSIDCANNTIMVRVIGFTANTTTKIAFGISISLYGHYKYCRTVVAATTQIGFYVGNALGYIEGCLASNKDVALYVAFMSTVSSANWSAGSGNTYGIRSLDASTVGKAGTQPQGTTAELQTNGGIIR
jgi:hypothetical protein